MDRSIYLLGRDLRQQYAGAYLQKCGRQVISDAADASGPALWVLPYPLRDPELLHRLPRGIGGYVIGGGLGSDLENRLASGGFCCYDAATEWFLLENARLTAEGALQLMLELLPCSVKGLPVLIVGYGRIGQALGILLQSLGADVTVAARRQCVRQEIARSGLRAAEMDFRGDQSRYRCVLLTVPAWVFEASDVVRFRSDCLWIELASRPFGMSRDTAELLGERYVMASGLPGRLLPESAGMLWGRAIWDVLEEHGL